VRHMLRPVFIYSQQRGCLEDGPFVYMEVEL
jgi:hypothetical protein